MYVNRVQSVKDNFRSSILTLESLQVTRIYRQIRNAGENTHKRREYQFRWVYIRDCMNS